MRVLKSEMYQGQRIEIRCEENSETRPGGERTMVLRYGVFVNARDVSSQTIFVDTSDTEEMLQNAKHLIDARLG